MMSFKSLVALMAMVVATVHGLPGPMARAISSVPTPAQYDGLVVIDSFPVEGGILTLYGDANPDAISKRVAAPAPEDLEKRCGTNQVSCYSSHQAPVDICDVLIVSLGTTNYNVPIRESPRSWCYSGGTGQCCVSWANVVSNGFMQYLQPAAKKVEDGCRVGNLVSGLARDVQLGGTCTTQCLSNRPSGCS